MIDSPQSPSTALYRRLDEAVAEHEAYGLMLNDGLPPLYPVSGVLQGRLVCRTGRTEDGGRRLDVRATDELSALLHGLAIMVAVVAGPKRGVADIAFSTRLDKRAWSRVRTDARARVMAAVAGLALATSLAAAFALVPRAGTWGADPGGESYSLYSTVSYAVLFIAVATRLRTRTQAYRLLAAMVSAGTVAARV